MVAVVDDGDNPLRVERGCRVRRLVVLIGSEEYWRDNVCNARSVCEAVVPPHS